MKKISIILDEKSIEKSLNKQVFGNICLSSEDMFFPEKNWNDFIVIVLNWWVTSLIKIKSKQSTEEICNFMDGSYAFKITITKTKLCNIIFYDTSNEETINIIENYIFEDICKEILNTAYKLQDFCLENHWMNNDIKELIYNIKRYEAYDC